MKHRNTRLPICKTLECPLFTVFYSFAGCILHTCYIFNYLTKFSLYISQVSHSTAAVVTMAAGMAAGLAGPGPPQQQPPPTAVTMSIPDVRQPPPNICAGPTVVPVSMSLATSLHAHPPPPPAPQPQGPSAQGPPPQQQGFLTVPPPPPNSASANVPLHDTRMVTYPITSMQQGPMG